MFDIMNVAKIIKEARISQNMTQMDLAPLLPPQDVKKFVNYQMEKTEDPQAGKDSENRKESKIDYYTIIGLAPFLSQADLDELIAHSEGDISPEALIALASFLSRRSVDELAMHLTGNIEIELMMGIMPFLSQDGRNKFWKKYGARKE